MSHLTAAGCTSVSVRSVERISEDTKRRVSHSGAAYGHCSGGVGEIRFENSSRLFGSNKYISSLNLLGYARQNRGARLHRIRDLQQYYFNSIPPTSPTARDFPARWGPHRGGGPGKNGTCWIAGQRLVHVLLSQTNQQIMRHRNNTQTNTFCFHRRRQEKLHPCSMQALRIARSGLRARSLRYIYIYRERERERDTDTDTL